MDGAIYSCCIKYVPARLAAVTAGQSFTCVFMVDINPMSNAGIDETSVNMIMVNQAEKKSPSSHQSSTKLMVSAS